MANKYTIYIDTLIKNRSFGKFLRSFCIFLSYLLLNVYTIISFYCVFQVIEIMLPAENIEPVFDRISDEERMVDLWTRWAYLALALTAFLSVGAMLHGVKRRKHYLMLPWIVYHMLLFYLHFLKDTISETITKTHSAMNVLILAMKFSFFLMTIVPVCFYYRKLHLDRLKRERKGAPLR